MDEQQIQQILKQYWGYDGLRGIQPSVIQAVLQNRDVLALMPTGGGKSLCFQVPALLRDGLCLVVSPLIALMQDQVQHLLDRGISAAALHSGLSAAEMNELYDGLEAEDYKFLYVSPERLDTAGFIRRIENLDVQLLVVDEAHCIAEWGYDFRPAYLKIGEIRKELGIVPCLALTASATPSVQKDIIDKLKLRDAQVLMQDFHRPELSYKTQSCLDAAEKKNYLIDLLTQYQGKNTLIYTRSRKAAEELTSYLAMSGVSSTFYHAGLPSEQRLQRQQDWVANKLPIMVCTSAFGMGIDKADVRLVVHFDPTDNLEAYCQQAGRAGRDGQAAVAVLLYAQSDIAFMRKMPEIFYPSLTTIREFYHDLADYFQLPVGLGEDQFFSFRIDDFSLKFNWKPLQVHSILKALEQSGLITYLEQVYLPAKLKITASRAQVESYSNGYKAAGEILDYLMRHYENIFIEPVTIKERQIAWGLYLDEASVRSMLAVMNREGFIQYMPARSLPQVHFLTGRAPAGSLLFDHVRYEKRKKWFEWRLDLMLRYIEQTDKCRSQMLAAYFGQALLAPCGTCDNCNHSCMTGPSI